MMKVIVEKFKSVVRGMRIRIGIFKIICFVTMRPETMENSMNIPNFLKTFLVLYNKENVLWVCCCNLTKRKM